MWFRSKRAHRDPAARGGIAAAPRRSQKFGPRAVEALEDRALMSQGGHHPVLLPRPRLFTSRYTETNLVSDLATLPDKTQPVKGVDTHLVNPWGIVAGPNTPWWVNDNGTGLTTLYNGDGVKQPLEVTIPPPAGDTSPSAPTGIVLNPVQDFIVSKNGKSGSSFFIFATEDGTISGWNPTVDPTNAVLMVDKSASGAVYKGLALASTGGESFLYATNFHDGTIDVFDSSFKQVSLAPGAFTDHHIPHSFAPFGIANIGGNLYVTYAKQDADKHDDVAGVGNGFVDVYAPNGTLLQRVAARGTLDSPWGLAVAPAGFGRFSGALLVGNFGDSRINAFDLKHGTFLGQLTGTDGNPLVLNGGSTQSQKGLWGIAFGNGKSAGDNNTLFFASGINDENDGLFGSVTPAKL